MKKCKDHHELEVLTFNTYDQKMAELTAENPAVGAALGVWMAKHKGHSKSGLRWSKPEEWDMAAQDTRPGRRWVVYGTCGRCRVNSSEYFVGDDN